MYAVTQEGDVWWIDQKLGEAQRVLDGTRLLTLPGSVRSVVTSGGTLIVDSRGGRLVALDPSAGIWVDSNDTSSLTIWLEQAIISTRSIEQKYEEKQRR